MLYCKLYFENPQVEAKQQTSGEVIAEETAWVWIGPHDSHFCQKKQYSDFISPQRFSYGPIPLLSYWYIFPKNLYQWRLSLNFSNIKDRSNFLCKELFPTPLIFYRNNIIISVVLVPQQLKNLPAMRETWVKSLIWEDPLEKEGKGYPLQYSGLENSMDCIVREVEKSQTQLSDFHLLTHSLHSLTQYYN